MARIAGRFVESSHKSAIFELFTHAQVHTKFESQIPPAFDFDHFHRPPAAGLASRMNTAIYPTQETAEIRAQLRPRATRSV